MRALLVAWWGLNFGYYGLATWITVLLADAGVGAVYKVAFWYALANAPGNAASLLLVERLGRRRLLVGAMAAAALTALAFAAADAADARGGAVSAKVALALAFNAFATAGWNALDCLSAECFRAPVRARALGALTAAGRVASIAAQCVNASLASRAPVLLSVTSAFMLVGAAASLALPEPRGRVIG